MCGGRQQGQTTLEIRTAPEDTTSHYKDFKGNGYQTQWPEAGRRSVHATTEMS